MWWWRKMACSSTVLDHVMGQGHTCTVVLLVVINLSDDIMMRYKPPAVQEQKKKSPEWDAGFCTTNSESAEHTIVIHKLWEPGYCNTNSENSHRILQPYSANSENDHWLLHYKFWEWPQDTAAKQFWEWPLDYKSWEMNLLYSMAVWRMKPISCMVKTVFQSNFRAVFELLHLTWQAFC